MHNGATCCCCGGKRRPREAEKGDGDGTGGKEGRTGLHVHLIRREEVGSDVLDAIVGVVSVW